MQPRKKHFPAVGIVTLVVIAAVTGSLYYYQFYVPHVTGCATSVHRVFFMTAIVYEKGQLQQPPTRGFNITRAAIYNETSAPLPKPANSTAQLNFTGVQLRNQTVSDPITIQANLGDTITIYMFAISTTSPPQDQTALGHGFGVNQYTIPNEIFLSTWQTWSSTTFTFEGSGTFRCLHQCSPNHGSMNGNLSVGGSCG